MLTENAKNAWDIVSPGHSLRITGEDHGVAVLKRGV